MRASEDEDEDEDEPRRRRSLRGTGTAPDAGGREGSGLLRFFSFPGSGRILTVCSKFSSGFIGGC